MSLIDVELPMSLCSRYAPFRRVEATTTITQTLQSVDDDNDDDDEMEKLLAQV